MVIVIASKRAFVSFFLTIHLFYKVNSWSNHHCPSLLLTTKCKFQKHEIVSSTRLQNVASDDKSQSSSSSSSSNVLLSDLDDKTIYQRAFYSFSLGSDIDIHKSIVIEERVRFEPDSNRIGYMQPIGPRTLILRDGNVDDGEIGNDFFTVHIAGKHNGVGNDLDVESTIATALYLSSNPSLCTGQVLEVACESGLASLLGCIGAAYVNGDYKNNENSDVVDEILTITKEHDPLLPKDLEKLTLADEDVENLEQAMKYCQKAGVKSAIVEQLEWRKRPAIRQRGSTRSLKEFRTIIASDVAYSYPEAKELARTVANRLEPALKYYNSLTESNKVITPRFVNICPDSRNEMTYLRNFLEKGYKMSTTIGYLKLEKLQFIYQKINNDDAKNDENNALDELELELHDINEIKYQSLIAQHHLDYTGGGSGELFFPMETGEYDATGGSTFLEPETGSSPS